MKTYTEYFTINTDKRREYLGITDRVEEAVRKSGVEEGMAWFRPCI